MIKQVSFGLLSGLLLLSLGPFVRAADEPGDLRVALFRCDLTPPRGQPLIAGDLVSKVEQPLWAKGLVLDDGRARYALCAVDWCELGNASHLLFRRKIAQAAGTEIAQVAVQCVHQHTAPVVDGDAQKLLAGIGAAHLHLDPHYLEQAADRLAEAVQQALGRWQRVDQIGTGQARVERVAATRRVKTAEGTIRVRYSFTKDLDLRARPEGLIDPFLKTITLAQGGRPIVRLHYYATHPQSRYGDGRVTSDLAGIAREQLERKEKVFQIYFTGCAGDITVGKYNDGSAACRIELAQRLQAGMESTIAATRLAAIGPIHWKTVALRLPARTEPAFSLAAYRAHMEDVKAAPSKRTCAGAQGLAFLQRLQRPFALSRLEIGNVAIVHLPGEPMVEFQLYAQKLRPRGFVAVAGYGDAAPGYLCTEQAYREGGYEPTASLVAPESEQLVKGALRELLERPQP